MKESWAEIPLPHICKNGPSILALKLWDEIFMPVWTDGCAEDLDLPA